MVGKRQELMNRSREIRGAVERELNTFEVPMTIQDLVRRVNSNRITVSRMVLEYLKAEKFSFSMARVGCYDILYKTYPKEDTNDANDTTETPQGNAKEVSELRI